jgi:hypothetical protein
MSQARVKIEDLVATMNEKIGSWTRPQPAEIDG